MKLKEDIVIFGKMINRNKVFVSFFLKKRIALCFLESKTVRYTPEDRFHKKEQPR